MKKLSRQTNDMFTEGHKPISGLFINYTLHYYNNNNKKHTHHTLTLPHRTMNPFTRKSRDPVLHTSRDRKTRQPTANARTEKHAENFETPRGFRTKEIKEVNNGYTYQSGTEIVQYLEN
jgi:hypothetical protein